MIVKCEACSRPGAPFKPDCPLCALAQKKQREGIPRAEGA